jgi:hypothetical protein
LTHIPRADPRKVEKYGFDVGQFRDETTKGAKFSEESVVSFIERAVEMVERCDGDRYSETVKYAHFFAGEVAPLIQIGYAVP